MSSADAVLAVKKVISGTRAPMGAQTNTKIQTLTDSSIRSERLRELCVLLRLNYEYPPQDNVNASDFEEIRAMLQEFLATFERHELAAALGEIGRVDTVWLWLAELAGVKPEATIADVSARVNLLYVENDSLTVEFRLPFISFVRDEYRSIMCIVTASGGKECAAYKVLATEEYADFSFFGVECVQGKHFQVSIPLKDIRRDCEISFRFEGESGHGVDAGFSSRPYRETMRAAFSRDSHLACVPGQYWATHDMFLTASATAISIRPYTKRGHVLRETALLARLLARSIGARKGKKRALGAFLVRVGYRLDTLFRSRDAKIWVMHDKMFSAQDNGEYFYRYVKDSRQASSRGIVPYYAVNKGVLDGRADTNGYRLIHPRSIHHRIIYLRADIIFATHANPAGYNAISQKNSLYLRDLMNAHIVCIQHGLTMQDISRFAHRAHVGTERYYIASKQELKNLLSPRFGYRPEQIALTGLPRFDGLVCREQRPCLKISGGNEPQTVSSCGKKQIMVAPTWEVGSSGDSGSLNEQRGVLDDFCGTSFYRRYQELFANPLLQEVAFETGYSFTFVLHPYMRANAPLCDFGDLVTVAPEKGGERYETMMNESSLMVTDYSGIQYDFAYMNKPLVYFHPQDAPAQYGHGAMEYASMGFGEIAHTTDELVEVLCSYMRTGCAMTEKYAQRVQDFFAFHDANNCKRIYEDVSEHFYGGNRCGDESAR